ncbi:MAG: ABC transporter ATP-binding protein [Acidimicrobiales bacterium]
MTDLRSDNTPATSSRGASLLAVSDLDVDFDTPQGTIQAVRGVSVEVNEGEVLGIVGESGSGKSVTMLASLGLLPANASSTGSVQFRGEELLGLPPEDLRRYRGRRIGMIFQDPLTSLNPVITIGQQLGGAIAAHHGRMRTDALRKRATELLDLVSIPEPDRRIDSYPHELSGGMRQRAMIALAVANEPDVLIADEPTTALDVTIQAQILEVLQEIRTKRGLAIVLITHDLGVIAGIADRLAVMYAGRVVEQGTVDDVFAESRHPYTRGLVACLPRLDRREVEIVPITGAPPSASALPSGCAFHPRCSMAIDVCATSDPRLERAGSVESACHRRDDVVTTTTSTTTSAATSTVMPAASSIAEPAESILRVVELEKRFDVRSTGLLRRVVGHIDAISGVSFELSRGQILGLVGESGCGKSTTGRSILRLIEPDGGTVTFDGVDILAANRSAMREIRRDLQIVFQDPFSSLNPKMKIGEIVSEPLIVHGTASAEAARRTAELLELVQLQPEHADRYPHQLSGGQRQRVSLARALSLDPDVLVLDEPVSALDVSIQAGIIRLLEDLRDRLDLGIVFIAHDLSVVRHVSAVVAVMYLGRIVEMGPNDEIFQRPSHPYTQALLSAVPIPDPFVERSRQRLLLTGDVPSGMNPPSGCRFRTRCHKAEDRCATSQPMLDDPGLGHAVACHFPEPLDANVAPAPTR